MKLQVISTVGKVPTVDTAALEEGAADLADDMATEYAYQTRQVLTSAGKVASRGTIDGVSKVLHAVSSRGRFQSSVVAPWTMRFIQGGRRAGAAAPLVRTGTGPNGGAILEAVTGLLQWMLVKGIPPRFARLIAYRIKRRGIKPLDVQGRANRASWPDWRAAMQYHVTNIVRRFFKSG